MAFNFLPPFAKPNDVQEQFRGSFSQPPPSNDSTQRGTNFNIPPPPNSQQLRYPRWQQPHVPWNVGHPRPQHYDQESHRVSQPVNQYPIPRHPEPPRPPQQQRYDQENHLATPVNQYPIPFIASGQFCGDSPLPEDPLKCRLQDEIWLNNWLSGHRSKSKVQSTERNSPNTLKVFQAREMLKKCLYVLHKLETSHQELLAQKEILTAQGWQDKWNQIQNMQGEVVNVLTTISNANNMEALKKSLIKRRKKRLAIKRRKKLCQQNQKKIFDRRQQLHDNINAWLKNMEDVVEKAKREESLKHEADLVLGEVTRKKAEARRQISLLSALLKLRQVRAQSCSSRGQSLPAESSERFMKVIEHLQKLWEDQLRGYNVEDQGLRVMLEEAVEERTQSYDKQAVAEWDRLLFGTKSSIQFRNFYLAAESSMDAFVAVRRSWDKYLAPPDAVMSCAIPVGWVLPTNPSSSCWEKHLKPHY